MAQGWLVAVLALGSLVAVAARGSAQAEIQGRVLTERDRRPLMNAEVSLPRLNIRSFTDSLGRFRLQDILPGKLLVVTRAVGFRPDSTVTLFVSNEALVRDVVLQVSVNQLPTVAVRDTSRPVSRTKMADYEQRRAAGIGRFIGRELLEKNENHWIADIIAANVPGVVVRRGPTGSDAWASSGRTTSTAKCGLCRSADAMLDPTDIAAGAPAACYLDVYFNGVLLYDSSRRMPLFNLNSLLPSDVEGIEVYTGAGQIPTQYNKTSGACGVMLVWTREPQR